MVVAGPEGFNKNAYRKFNIKTEGRRGRRLRHDARGDEPPLRARAGREIPIATTSIWPDLVLIDGGQGQLEAGAGW